MKSMKFPALLIAAALVLPGMLALAEDQNTARSGAGAGAGAAAAGQNQQGAAGQQAGQSDDAAQPAGARATATAGRAGKMTPEQLFVRGAASGNQMEIEAAKLAQHKSQRQEIKEFAQHIIDDHTKAGQRLQQIAQSKQIQIRAGEMKASHRAQIQELSELDGEQFDKAFVISNVGDHMKMLLKFRDASQNLQDAELKAFATETLPKLQSHLEHAQQLAGWDQATTAGARERGSRDASGTDSASPTGRDAKDRGTDATNERQPGARSGTSGTDAAGTDTAGGTKSEDANR
jgi:putative membrane protein